MPAALCRGHTPAARKKDPLGAADDLDQAIDRMEAPMLGICLERARLLRGVGQAATERLLAGLDAGANRLGPVIALSALAIDIEAERNRRQQRKNTQTATP